MSGVFEKTELCGGGFVAGISYNQLTSQQNILHAWQRFSRGKWQQTLVRRFWFRLEAELASLYHDLGHGAYQHGQYMHFVTHDTKRREIHVAPVRDRVVHELLAGYCSTVFGPQFIAHSYAAQVGKGVAAARAYVFEAIQTLGRAGKPVWIGKLDVEQYFANIDHAILIELLFQRIHDPRIRTLFQEIIASFGNRRGVPLGNATSQWFGNIYLHEMDWHTKYILHIPQYARYNDDVIIVGNDERLIRQWVGLLQEFVTARLRVSIPNRKTSITQLPTPVDILGWVADGSGVWLRSTTTKRARSRLLDRAHHLHPRLYETVCSYARIGIDNAFNNLDCII